MERVIKAIVPDDDPIGIRKYYLEGTNCVLFVIPRGCEKGINSNKLFVELGWPCLYILSNNNKYYIGQANSFSHRIGDHNQKKRWWEYAYVFVPTNKDVDVEYLEYRALNDAQSNHSVYVELDNKNTPKEHAHSDIAEIVANQFYDYIQFMASFVGCNLFNPPKDNDFVWICEAKQFGIKAFGAYNKNVFTIKAGSTVRKDNAPSYKAMVERNRWLKEYTKPNKNGQQELIKDYQVQSPSKASGLVLGRPSNGWEDWRNKQGVSLKEIYE